MCSIVWRTFCVHFFPIVCYILVHSAIVCQNFLSNTTILFCILVHFYLSFALSAIDVTQDKTKENDTNCASLTFNKMYPFLVVIVQQQQNKSKKCVYAYIRCRIGFGYFPISLSPVPICHLLHTLR